MRLQHGGAYTSDISAFRGQIRQNGTLANVGIVNVSHPQSANTVDLYINLAYQANSNFPPINGSLYTVAFGNNNGIWHFNVGAIGVALPGAAIPGALAGDYASLGYPLALPAITDANLLAAVNSVSNYAGAAPVPAPVLDGLTRLIIAVNEAARFDQVESGIDGILGNGGVYPPPVATIHNWGGHILGS
nr:ribosome-inactivating family protein [uncultured Desulfuromonas sp.]